MHYEKILHYFFLFFNTFLHCQIVELSAAAYSTISGYTLYYQIQDRNAFKLGDPLEQNYSQAWHKLQTLEVLSIINVGYQINSTNKYGAPGVITDVIETGAIRWILRDGIYNVLLGRSFFYQSEVTTAQFEYLGTPVVKISFLITVILFKYYVLPLIAGE